MVESLRISATDIATRRQERCVRRDATIGGRRINMDEKQASKDRSGRTSSRKAAPKVPPLPKLHSRGPLVTTELSKPVSAVAT